jgi:hypothetical protein
MAITKSLDEVNIVTTILIDIRNQNTWFSSKACSLTIRKIRKRYANEGKRFLTEALPSLGKALDRALSSDYKLDPGALGFETRCACKIPLLFGELFERVISSDGSALKDPCVVSVRYLRDLTYLFYKYEIALASDKDQAVIDSFIKTEEEVRPYDELFTSILEEFDKDLLAYNRIKPDWSSKVIRKARRALHTLFRRFDPRDITPRHGPGVVSTKEKLWGKYLWSNVPDRLTAVYPLDEYFFPSMDAVCDKYREFSRIGGAETPAQVILVPKDSRGQRLISCEPLYNMWIQQGLGHAIVDHVERHPLTRGKVNFTDQEPNRRGALLGSSTGRYATLDLKEASDRVSLGLVRLLFPGQLVEALLSCRSQSTRMPDGSEVKLHKFAPMGSSLCFPVLALTIWSLLHASMDTDSRERILVYGDDVIVPTEQSAYAIAILESFGLKVNVNKSCTSGLFRESCGMDAIFGVCVTPVRCRTVWRNVPSPDAYVSWISYANSCYDKHYFTAYEYIVEKLHAVYGAIPSDRMGLPVPSLREVSESNEPKRRRRNTALQKVQYWVNDVRTPRVVHEMDGWSMLLRYFAESRPDRSPHRDHRRCEVGEASASPFSVREYTKRRAIKLAKRWKKCT